MSGVHSMTHKITVNWTSPKFKNFSLKAIKATRKTMHWGNTFAKHISENGLVLRICKEFSKFNRKINSQIPKRKVFAQTLHQKVHTHGT